MAKIVLREEIAQTNLHRLVEEVFTTHLPTVRGWDVHGEKKAGVKADRSSMNVMEFTCQNIFPASLSLSLSFPLSI